MENFGSSFEEHRVNVSGLNEWDGVLNYLGRMYEKYSETVLSKVKL